MNPVPLIASGSNLSGPTVALVIVTAALVVVTGVMAWSTWRSSTKTAEAAQAAVRAAIAAEADLKQGQELIRVGQDQIEVSRSQVTEAHDQAEVSRLALEASVQPLLVDVVVREPAGRTLDAGDGHVTQAQVGPEPKCFIASDTHFWVVFPVRNIGPGPAVIGTGHGDVQLIPYYQGEQRIQGRPSTVVVAPHDVVDLVFCSPHPNENLLRMVNAPPGPSMAKVATIELRYSDVTGSKITLTRFTLGKGAAPFLRVTGIEIEH